MSIKIYGIGSDTVQIEGVTKAFDVTQYPDNVEKLEVKKKTATFQVNPLSKFLVGDTITVTARYYGYWDISHKDEFDTEWGVRFAPATDSKFSDGIEINVPKNKRNVKRIQ